MHDERFTRYVEEGIEMLPTWVRTKLVNVAFLVADEPTKKQHAQNALETDDILFGLYEGVPLTERGDESILMPDTITIFKKPVYAMYTREEDIRTCIHNTVWHEVAHYFGHDEEWVAFEEIKRGKLL